MSSTQLQSGEHVRVKSRVSEGLTYGQVIRGNDNRPTNKELHYLLMSGKYKDVKEGFPTVASDWVAIPEKGKGFRKGHNITDAVMSSRINASDFKKAKIEGGDPYAPGNALDITSVPDGVRAKKSGVVEVVPAIVTVVTGIQTSGATGKVDEKTGLIKQATHQELNSLSYGQKGWMYYNDTETLRPPVRDFGGLGGYGDRQDVGLDYVPVIRVGVLEKANLNSLLAEVTKISEKEPDVAKWMPEQRAKLQLLGELIKEQK